MDFTLQLKNNTITRKYKSTTSHKEGVICIMDGLEEAVDGDMAFNEVTDNMTVKNAIMGAIKIATR